MLKPPFDMKPITEEIARERLAVLCSRSEHCISQVREKMYTWGIAPEAQDRIVDYLLAHQYIDEERFARVYIEDKVQYNGWGPRKIAQMLAAKRIDKQVVRNILEEIDPQVFVEQLQPLLRQKQRSVTGKTDYERYCKLIRFALGRGYEMETIRQCLEEVEEDEP